MLCSVLKYSGRDYELDTVTVNHEGPAGEGNGEGESTIGVCSCIRVLEVVGEGDAVCGLRFRFKLAESWSESVPSDCF